MLSFHYIILKLEKETHVPFISLTLVPQPMIDSVFRSHFASITVIKINTHPFHYFVFFN